MKKIFLITIALVAFACSSKKPQTGVVVSPQAAVLARVSTDSTYGLTPQNPVESGGGPSGERAYLDALAGPNGQKIKYYRIGSCCPVESKNGMMGMAMLDNYSVSYSGIKKTVSIYINMYDKGELKAPVGFTVRKFE